MARVASQGAIEAALSHNEGVLTACYRVAEAVADMARGLAPKGPGAGRYNHGRGSAQGVMASQINADHTSYGGRARSHADWSAPVEGGWGIYGIHNHSIHYRKPVTFKVKARGGLPSGRIITTRAVLGAPAQPFMSEAARVVCGVSPGLTWRPYPKWMFSRL